MNKLLAELIGTFTLVFLGCGSAVMATTNPDLGPGLVGISMAFGLALIGMAYGIGAVSGCHINPAVSLGAMLAGRMPQDEMLRYWGAQIIGATLGALAILLIMQGKLGGYEGGYGANGWGTGYLGEFNMMSALLFEIIATFLFVVVILGATGKGAASAIAGLGIGLTLIVIHIVGINITGVSVNPARSFGPALFSGGTALAQLWLFMLAPMIGGAASGILFRTGLLDADTPKTNVQVDASA
ncbi:aquaporin [Sulfitobacter geojensis]|uniref:Aquaporin n=2 Tax=Sulfitobacter geojensis TaxID=1342299 RepID=A0AAE2VVB8_9RHOB|nr:aquaporin [Sulfitobacter geojensis]MBM1687774.1 aquaporin [Sulfitobacter geojensis]MBM1691841.1 aquaporin [Sulfitobacter geojensis]MBM1704007.1 aquaporin [Sulfitobacter geojensis]MBM1708065.1 aquaporin [Sulfitobacter geojensis]MBM1712130.1 aquaporin [Sulfitobacter geojensis]